MNDHTGPGGAIFIAMLEFTLARLRPCAPGSTPRLTAALLGLAMLLGSPRPAAAVGGAADNRAAGARGGASDSLSQEIDAKICIVAPSAGPPLEEFGPVIWRHRVKLGSEQCACLGDLFYEGASTVDFGLLTSRFRDRLYFRTPRRILREWTLPAAGQPDSALAWARAFVRRFDGCDTLFVDLRVAQEPFVAHGERGARTGLLFRHWVARELSPADRRLAASLGVSPERLVKPPPEPICPPGGG